MAHAGSLAAVGNLHRNRLTGQAVTLAGVADKNILPGQIRHVQRVRAGLPGLAAVCAVLHIRRGVQRLIVRVKDQHRSAGVLGDHHSDGPAGKVLPGGRIAEKDRLAQIIGGVQRLGEGGPGLAAVSGELHALVRADGLRLAVHLHLGGLPANGNGHGHTAAGEGIAVPMIADDNCLPGQIGHVHGLVAGVPGQAAVNGVVHIGGCVHCLGNGVQLHHRILCTVRNPQLGGIAGKLVLGRCLPNEDGLAGQVGNIHIRVALGPGLAAVRAILHASGGVDRLLVPVNGEIRLVTLLRDLHQHGQAGKMVRIVLLPNSQLLAVEAGHIQPVSGNGSPAAFRPVLRHGAGDGQQLRHTVNVSGGGGVPAGDGHGGVIAGGLGAVTGIAHQQGGVGQLGQVHVVQTGDPGLAAVPGILHGGGSVHAFGGVVNGQHRSRPPNGNGHSGGVALKGIVRGGDPHQQRLALPVLHVLPVLAGLPGFTAVIGILHAGGGVHGKLEGIHLHVRGSGTLRQNLHDHGAGFAGAIVHQSDIDGCAGGNAAVVG